MSRMKYLIFILGIIFLYGCNAPNASVKSSSANKALDADVDSQIGQYVGVFQDSKGNLWFPTLEKGVAKYDGNALSYLTTVEGLPSNRVVSIVEEDNGVLWFGTGRGLSKFDGKKFINYSEQDGLCSDMISNLLIDRNDKLWIGTWGGVCTFDGVDFKRFHIPYPEVETPINPDTRDWITSIIEDDDGNIWFGRDGYGACKFDGQKLTNVTTADGLNSNNVQSIVEDNEGDIWIGTRVAEKDNADENTRFGKGGLNKLEGDIIIHFPNLNGLSDNDVYVIYEDLANDLWFSTVSNGVYKYSNGEFINYEVPAPIMDILQDDQGNIWLGCAGGVYRIDKEGGVINVKTNGPWK